MKSRNILEDSGAKESLLVVPKFSVQPVRVQPNGTPLDIVTEDEEEGLGYTHTLVSQKYLYISLNVFKYLKKKIEKKN